MRRRRSHGFTLLELTCVLVILIVLVTSGMALLSTPLFRSRTAEPMDALGVIAALEETRRIEGGSYLACPAWPADVPRGSVVGWAPPEPWQRLGFRAGAENRYQYEVTVGTRTTERGEEPYFVAEARGDIDGDGRPSRFRLDSRDRRVIRVEEGD